MAVSKSLMLPPETPEWGAKLLEIIQVEFWVVAQSITQVEDDARRNSKDIKQFEKKLTKMEKQNKSLTEENVQLKEKLLELEYRQKRNNLIFEGVVDSQGETDLDCIRKVRFVLKDIPGLDVNGFRIDRCY